MLIYLFIGYMIISCLLCIWTQHKQVDKWPIYTIVIMLVITPIVAVCYLSGFIIKILFLIFKSIFEILWLWIRILFTYIRIFIRKMFYKITHKKSNRWLYKCDPKKNVTCNKNGCKGGYCNLTFDKKYSVDGKALGRELDGPILDENGAWL